MNKVARSDTGVIKRIVILGGGSAGWLTAGVLAAEHGPEKVQVTLIESPGIPPIGVGEGTWPSMRATLNKIGLSETELFRQCDAAFKQGAKFAKWVTGEDNDFYYHPLMLPQGFNDTDLVLPWQLSGSEQSFADAVCCQSHLCEQGKAPKQITTPEFASVANYAYHLDSVKLGQLLQQHCTEKLAVKHVLDEVTEVQSDDSGDIAALVTAEHGPVAGDLFIDCSGQRSLLLGQHYQVPFISKQDTLFNDTAMAVHVPYFSDDDAIASHTISTAHRAGWIWDIGLPTRRGVGIVYASEYMDDSEAEQTLKTHIAGLIGVDKANKLKPRKIPIDAGHRQTFWHRNCVAVGLSAGFLEPLEASALVLVESSAAMISKDLPANREVMDIIARRFNQRLNYYWETIVDFLKLHYVLSQRQDSDYWRAHQDPATWSDNLRQSLALWQTQVPNKYDFPLAEEMFPAASWQYVLYGMGFRTQTSIQDIKTSELEKARMHMAQAADFTRKCLAGLPDNRTLINKIKEFGLQRV